MPNAPFVSKRKPLTEEELQREFDYWRAEKILQQMMKKGLISEAEFNKIMALNRESFSPMLAQIMP
ncbi:SHOCT domain-containing protein [Bacillota bacterium Lsc_1132]